MSLIITFGCVFFFTRVGMVEIKMEWKSKREICYRSAIDNFTKIVAQVLFLEGLILKKRGEILVARAK